MGDIVKKIEELIDEGRCFEIRRKKFPTINWFDAIDEGCEGTDRREIAGNDKDSGTGVNDAAKGKQEKELCTKQQVIN